MAELGFTDEFVAILDRFVEARDEELAFWSMN